MKKDITAYTNKDLVSAIAAAQAAVSRGGRNLSGRVQAENRLAALLTERDARVRASFSNGAIDPSLQPPVMQSTYEACGLTSSSPSIPPINTGPDLGPNTATVATSEGVRSVSALLNDVTQSTTATAWKPNVGSAGDCAPGSISNSHNFMSGSNGEQGATCIDTPMALKANGLVHQATAPNLDINNNTGGQSRLSTTTAPSSSAGNLEAIAYSINGATGLHGPKFPPNANPLPSSAALAWENNLALTENSLVQTMSSAAKERGESEGAPTQGWNAQRTPPGLSARPATKITKPQTTQSNFEVNKQPLNQEGPPYTCPLSGHAPPGYIFRPTTTTSAVGVNTFNAAFFPITSPPISGLLPSGAAKGGSSHDEMAQLMETQSFHFDNSIQAMMDASHSQEVAMEVQPLDASYSEGCKVSYSTESEDGATAMGLAESAGENLDVTMHESAQVLDGVQQMIGNHDKTSTMDPQFGSMDVDDDFHFDEAIYKLAQQGGSSTNAAMSCDSKRDSDGATLFNAPSSFETTTSTPLNQAGSGASKPPVQVAASLQAVTTSVVASEGLEALLNDPDLIVMEPQQEEEVELRLQRCRNEILYYDSKLKANSALHTLSIARSNLSKAKEEGTANDAAISEMQAVLDNSQSELNKHLAVLKTLPSPEVATKQQGAKLAANAKRRKNTRSAEDNHHHGDDDHPVRSFGNRSTPENEEEFEDTTLPTLTKFSRDRDRFESFSEEKKAEWIRKGEEALRKATTHGNLNLFGPRLRTLVRNSPYLLADSCAHSVSLSKEILTNSLGFSSCLAHLEKSGGGSTIRGTKRSKQDHDTVLELKGVAFPPIDRWDKKVDQREPEPGHLHCGCAEDDSVLDLFLTKTTQLRSTNPRLAGISQHYMGKPCKCAHRQLWQSSLLNYTGLTVRDLLRGTYGTDDYEIGLSMRQMHTQVVRLCSLGLSVNVTFSTTPEEPRWGNLWDVLSATRRVDPRRRYG